jgi:phenylacetate-CoA ligase
MLPPFDPWFAGIVALDVVAAARATRAGVLARQRRRLAALLEDAAARSRLLKERLGRRDPATVPLTAIAPLTKAELMHRFADAVTDPRLRIDELRRFAADPARIGEACPGGQLLWTSSGSSGEPGVFVQDARALAVYDALEALRRPLRADANWWPGQRFAFVGATSGHFASTVSVERLRRLVPGMAGTLRGFSFLQPIGELSAQLEAFAPDAIATYPTMALLLAEHARAGRLAIAPRQVSTGGETLSPLVRAAIESGFGCHVVDSYGASEFLAIAAECRCGTLHLNADWVILESVDERYAPVPDGETGCTTLLTNLANRLQPLVRYDLGDRIRLHRETCACGSPLPGLDVEGRSDELLSLRDAQHRTVQLPPLALTTVLEDDAGVFDFQLEQCGKASLKLRIAEGGVAGQQALSRALEALARYLARHGLPRVRIDGKCGARLRRGASGKAPRIVGMRHATRPARTRRGPRAARRYDFVHVDTGRVRRW